MPTGHVKWFNNAKGFGFIIQENGDEDYFAHYSEIQIEGYKTLRAGQAVTFEVQKGDKGSHATHIVPSELDQHLDKSSEKSSEKNSDDRSDRSSDNSSDAED